uniref:Uncharacterized protein n=1 Tax=Avena sativa TaxID=4498 RepID=A0ACD5VCQ1_AVESA
MLHSDPLLLMQVTVFSCGGFVLGLTWDHCIADGVGIGQFMQAVGELSRRLPSPSVIPAGRWDGSLICIHQTLLRIHGLQQSSLVLVDIRLPSSLISRIKQEFSMGAHKCSTFEVLTVVLWPCRTRAVMDDPKAPTMLAFAVNTRKYAGAKDGYYGNCIIMAPVMSTCDLVANRDIKHVINMIQRAKNQISGQYSNHNKHDVDGLQEFHANKGLLGYNYCTVSCWRNLGIEKADFGGGRPARVKAYTKSMMSLPICFLCPPCKDNEFFSVTSLCVKEEHAGAFLRELSNFT